MAVIRPWRRLSSRPTVRAKTFVVNQDQVELPGGAHEVVEYSYLDQPKSVIIVPVAEEGRLLMIEQYRYPAGRVLFEFPAGATSEGETPEEAARRELSEEIGGTADELTQLGSFFISTSVTNAEAHVFLARGLRPGTPSREPTEQMLVHEVPVNEFAAMIRDGRVHDSVTIASYNLAIDLLSHQGGGEVTDPGRH